MYSVEKKKKEFDICLEDVDAKFRADYPADGSHTDGLIYTGVCTSDSRDDYTFGFNQEPSTNEKTNIDTYYDGIKNNSSEATNYFDKEDATKALQKAKEDIPTKTWATMSTIQKKIIAGAVITDTDSRQLIADFPKKVS